MDATADAITERTRQLLARSKLSMNALSKEMGYKGASSIQRYFDPGHYKGGFLSRDVVERFAHALIGRGEPAIEAAEVWELAGVEFVPQSQTREEEPDGDAVFISGEQTPYIGPRDVEKLGVVAAGDDGDFQFNGEVIDRVRRPRGLVGRPGVFALELISGSMYPAYRKGDVVFCDRMDPKIGDDVVIETFAEDGETSGKAFIKRLVRRSASSLVVEQFNPAQELTFNRYAVKHVWRVVPNRELHGY